MLRPFFLSEVLPRRPQYSLTQQGGRGLGSHFSVLMWASAVQTVRLLSWLQPARAVPTKQVRAPHLSPLPSHWLVLQKTPLWGVSVGWPPTPWRRSPPWMSASAAWTALTTRRGEVRGFLGFCLTAQTSLFKSSLPSPNYQRKRKEKKREHKDWGGRSQGASERQK